MGAPFLFARNPKEEMSCRTITENVRERSALLEARGFSAVSLPIPNPYY